MSWARLANRPNNGNYSPNKRNDVYQSQSHNQQYNEEYNHQQHQPYQSYYQSNQSHQPRHQRRQRHNQQSNKRQHHIVNAKNQKVAITSSKRKHGDIHTVILDSGAFIGRQSFFNNFQSSTQYYMTPAVNNEVRDKTSRQFLDNFPYQINIKKPDPSSMKYVSRFIQKHPNLKSLSKVDRQVVALTHTLELQFEGDKNLRSIDEISKKNKSNTKSSKKFNYAQSESGVMSKVKKSKSGRIHTQLQPMDDTGVRLAVMKKIVPFHFDDFMTLTAETYGEKYGKPASMDLLHSPARLPVKANVDSKESKEIKQNDQEKKKEQKYNKTEEKQKEEKLDKFSMQIDDDDESDEDKNNELKMNKKDDASTEKKKGSQSPSPSKAQKRRLRKKNAVTKQRALHQSASQSVNAIDLMDARASVDDNSEHSGIMMENINLNDELPALDGDAKSEIDKMIEHDLNTTFSETASLISTLSETNLRQLKQYNEMNARLKMANSAPFAPSSESTAQASSVHFGTLFTGKAGSLFNTVTASQPMQPLPQQETIQPLKPVQPTIQQTQMQKKNVDDAWKGDWLTPDNYKDVKKNSNKKNKQKVENVENSSNKTSAVAAITVDLAMQRCMIEMGLRVLSTTASRQFGNNKYSEPVEYVFRCYGCFQFENNTNRIHCRWCGGQTFQRVAIYQDENGKSHYRYYYRDRFGYKYLEKHSLVPRGSQLIKNKGTNSNNHSNYQRNHRGGNKQKRRHKKRPYLGGAGGGGNYRRNNSGSRW